MNIIVILSIDENGSPCHISTFIYSILMIPIALNQLKHIKTRLIYLIFLLIINEAPSLNLITIP